MKNALIARRRSTSIRPHLMSGAVLSVGLSPAERTAGRLMRAPDDHGGTPAPSPTPPVFDFPDTVTDLASVPEKARPLYVKSGDVFKLDDLSGLRSALEHEKTERRSLAQKAAAAKKWEGLGKTPEEIQTLLEAQEAAEQKRLHDAGDFESIKAQMAENHAREMGAKDTKIGNLVKQIEKLMLSDHAKSVLAEKDIEGNPTLLLPAIRDRVQVVENEETGEFVLQVKRQDGKPLLNENNEPASLRDLVMQLKQDENYSGAFKGINQSGGGTPNLSGGGAPISDLKRSKMSVREKTAFIQKHGQEAFGKLPY